MRALVVYDSRYENTEEVARAIGEAIGAPVLQVGDLKSQDLEKLYLLIVGSPTHGGFPSKGIDGLLKASPDLEEIAVAAFDTGTKSTIFGSAAPKMARRLEKSGGSLLAPPEDFFVLEMKEPLKDRELERAVG